MNKYRSAMEKITLTPQMKERILTKLNDKKESEREIKRQQNPKRFRPVLSLAACCAVIICVLAIYPLLKNNLGNQQIQVSQPTSSSGATSVPQTFNSEGSEVQQGASPSERLGSLSSSGTTSVPLTSNLDESKVQQGASPSEQPGSPNSSEDNAESGGPVVTGGNPVVDIKGIEELKKLVPFQLMIPEKFPSGYKMNSTSIISGELAQIIYSDGKNEITYRIAKGSNDVSGDNTFYPQSNNTKVGSVEVKLNGSNSLVNLATWTNGGCSYALTFSAGMSIKDVTSIIKSIKNA
ncbi:MAG TPA: DUF4367 domain-containing protein [Ruminiclostridium sp.]|nr:DUF4367 domain-containing protein [Ruminiclostridium sp.]